MTAIRYFIAGMQPRGTEDAVRAMDSGAALELRREPTNAHDKNAVQIWSGDLMIGYVRGYQAKVLAPTMDAAKKTSLSGTLAFTDNSKVPVVMVEE